MYKHLQKMLITTLLLTLLLPILCIPTHAAATASVTQLIFLRDGSIAALLSDGTVHASDSTLNRKVSSWKNISSLYYAQLYDEPAVLAGLTQSGEVVCTSPYMSNWKNIDKLYFSYDGAVGLTRTGDVLTCGIYTNGNFFSGLRNVKDLIYSDIRQQFACLKRDGTVCIGLRNWDDSFEIIEDTTGSKQKNVAELYDSGHGLYYVYKDGSVYSDITGSCPELKGAAKIYSYNDWLFGLSKDGTLLTPRNESIYCFGGTFTMAPSGSPEWVGADEYRPSNYTNIKDIVFLGSGWILLKKDGTVDVISFTAGQWDLSSWNHIDKVYTATNYDTGEEIIYGIKDDGTVIAAASVDYKKSTPTSSGFEGYRIVKLFVDSDKVIGETKGGKLIGAGSLKNTVFIISDK